MLLNPRFSSIRHQNLYQDVIVFLEQHCNIYTLSDIPSATLFLSSAGDEADILRTARIPLDTLDTADHFTTVDTPLHVLTSLDGIKSNNQQKQCILRRCLIEGTLGVKCGSMFHRSCRKGLATRFTPIHST